MIQPEPEMSESFEKFERRLLSVEALLALPAPEWTVEGVLQEAPLSLIYGDGASFKSFLALDLALTSAAGRDWHHRRVKQERTLYVAAEGTGGLGARVRSWLMRNNVETVEGFTLYPGAMNLLAVGDMETLIAACQVYGFSRIVVDTLRRSMPGAEENSAKEVGAVVSNLGRLYEETGVRATVIHHANKSGGYRGSSAIFDDSDNVLKMERDRAKDPLYALLTVEKTKDGAEAPPLGLRLCEVGDSLVIAETEDATRSDAALGFVVEFVLEAEKGGGTSTRELQNAGKDVGLSRDAVRHAIERAIENDLVERASRKAPILPTAGLKWARRGGLG